MSKLKYSEESTDKRGITTRIHIIVDYDLKTHSILPEAVYIQQGEAVLEVMDSLDKFTGKPLDAMLNEIDWHQVYLDYKESLDDDWYKVKNIFRSIQTPAI